MNEAIRPGADIPPQAQEGPELSVIVPTFNERDNVTVLYRRLEATLANIAWEVVFVDDNSPDGTWDVVRALSKRDSRVRCVRRIGRRGLSGACIEGILASSAPYVAVIDADLQHDETQLPKMLLLLASDQADLVVGSRYVEIPYTFGARQHGESKLDSMVALDFLGLVLAKLTNDIVSLRFILFAMVGGIGLVVHLTTLFIALRLFNAPFAEAQAAGAIVAMTSNFILNNFLTYRDQRLKGFALLRGLIAFYIVCSVGLLANVGVAFSVYDQEPIWWLAGMAGALMGVVWNYAMSGLFVWRKK